MGQRNRTVDLEMEQQQAQASFQPEPCILLGSFPQQPDMNNNIPVPAMVEPHSLQDPTYDHSAMFYGLPQYHHHQQQHHQQRAAPANFYVPYVAFQSPPPPPLPSQLPSSSNHGLVGVSSDHEYERHAHFMDHSRGMYKRKNAEGVHGNPQYLTPFSPPEGISPFGGARIRPGAVTMNPVLPPHAPNSFVQGNYHPFPPPGAVWYDQHHGRSDVSPSFWPHAPYMHGSSNIVPGSIESSSRNPTTFMYPSQLNPRDHYYSHHHHPAPPPVQGVRGQTTTLYPHMASSYRVPPGNFAPQNTMNSGPSGSEMGPIQPTGFRIFQHHQRDDSVPVATLRQHRGGVPRLRLMPDDEVALLEFGDFLGGPGHNHIDHHRDMRLDIEEMSYEDLLALSERIGTVNTGLPEEEVKNHLKTRTCLGINLEKESSSSPRTKDMETEPCTICQESFKNEEKIATLDCGHEYHAECLEKWLIVKNVCPICKSEALVMEKGKV